MKRDLSLISLGKVVKPHGIKGAVQVYPYSDKELLLTVDTLFIKQDGKIAVPFTVSWAKQKKKNLLLLQFVEISDRNMAEELAGHEIFVDRNTVPQTASRRYYHFQLYGLEVHDVNQRFNGRLEGVIDAGGNDVFVIINEDGKEILVPAADEFILNIDVDKGKCLVDIPKELLEIYI